jgi:hypothetical protein
VDCGDQILLFRRRLAGLKSSSRFFFCKELILELKVLQFFITFPNHTSGVCLTGKEIKSKSNMKINLEVLYNVEHVQTTEFIGPIMDKLKEPVNLRIMSQSKEKSHL